MTGWVSYTLMTLYTNLGEVEDGVKTVSIPYDLTDQPDAIDLEVKSGEIIFDRTGFA